MSATPEQKTIEVQTAQAVDPAAICSAWLPLLIANGFDEATAKILIHVAEHHQASQLTASQAYRVRSVGKVKLAKLRKIGIVESGEVEWERTTRKWRREKANEIEAEITKVENWKASTIAQADAKMARLRKELAELKPNEAALHRPHEVGSVARAGSSAKRMGQTAATEEPPHSSAKRMNA